MFVVFIRNIMFVQRSFFLTHVWKKKISNYRIVPNRIKTKVINKNNNYSIFLFLTNITHEFLYANVLQIASALVPPLAVDAFEPIAFCVWTAYILLSSRNHLPVRGHVVNVFRC